MKRMNRMPARTLIKHKEIELWKRIKKTNCKECFQELIGIIKIGLQDFRMRKDESDKYRFRLGIFLNELKELNKRYQYYKIFADLCKAEFLSSSSFAYKKIMFYKNA